MHLQCPQCQQPIIPGATWCQGCGTSLLREATPGGAEPTCAVHPNRASLAICDRCGTFACAQCLRQNARGELVCLRCHGLEPDLPLPWDRREELGTLKAFGKTVLDVMLHPDTLLKARAEGSAGSSLLFVLLCALPSALMTGLTYLGLFSLMPSLVPEETGASGDIARGVGLGMFAFSVLVGPLLVVAFTVISAGLDHVVLKLGGVTRDFHVTLRAHALSMAPWVLGLVPCIGMYAAPVWAVVARCYAYRGLHQTTWGVAVTGALAIPILSCCLCGGGYAAMLLGLANLR